MFTYSFTAWKYAEGSVCVYAHMHSNSWSIYMKPSVEKLGTGNLKYLNSNICSIVQTQTLPWQDLPHHT